MNTTSLKTLCLMYIVRSTKYVYRAIKNKKIKIPTLIAEQIMDFMNDSKRGLTEDDILLLSQFDTTFTRFTAYDLRIKNLECLDFLKSHPIEKLSIQAHELFRTIDNVENIVTIHNLVELEIGKIQCRPYSFLYRFQSTQPLNNLKKLSLYNELIFDHTISELNALAPKLEELSLRNALGLNFEYIAEMKNLKILTYSGTISNFRNIFNLRKLNNLKEFYFDTSLIMTIEEIISIFFESNWSLNKLYLRTDIPYENLLSLQKRYF